MNLNYSSKAFSQLTHNEPSKKSAIHEAGHAVAIYLGNRQKQLPPFFFDFLDYDPIIRRQIDRLRWSSKIHLLNNQKLVK